MRLSTELRGTLPRSEESPAPSTVFSSRPSRRPLAVYAIVFLTGLISLSLEVTAPRLLSTTYGSTMILWAVVISVTLGGLATGYYLAALAPPRSAPALTQASLLLAAVGVAAIKPLVWVLVDWFPNVSVRSMVAVATLSMLVPFVFLGAVPVLLLNSLQQGSPAAAPSQCAGRAYAVSTFGSIVGALAAALFGIPYLGLNLSLALLTALLVVTGVMHGRSLKPLALLVVAALPMQTSMSWERHPNLLEYKQSAYQGIRVLAHPRTGQLSMWLDAGLNAALDPVTGEPLGPFVHEAVATATKAKVRSALILGGAGNTIALALERNGIATQTVEIDREVVALSARHFGVPRGEVHVQDARAFLRETGESFDCIILDAFSGPFIIPPHLLSQEFFRAVATRLAPDGFLLMNFFGALEGDYSAPAALLSTTIASVLGRPRAVVVSTVTTPATTISGVMIATGRALALRDDYIPLPESAGDVVTDDKNAMDLLMLEATHAYFAGHPLTASF